MNHLITEKWLRKKEDTQSIPKKYKFILKQVPEKNKHGFELEGREGKYNLVMTNFIGYVGKDNILGINPAVDPEIPAAFIEFTEEEAAAEKDRILAERAAATEAARAEQEAKLDAILDERLAKEDAIVAAFEAGTYLGGDETLFNAIHKYTPAEHKAKKQKHEDKKDKKNK